MTIGDDVPHRIGGQNLWHSQSRRPAIGLADRVGFPMPVDEVYRNVRIGTDAVADSANQILSDLEDGLWEALARTVLSPGQRRRVFDAMIVELRRSMLRKLVQSIFEQMER
jgi:hypothetical protein